MTTVLKSLGQSAPSATTETDLYTCPASTSAVVSSLVVCNRSSSASATFRISHSVGGGATANKDYLYYDVMLVPNATFTATLGISIATTDKIRVYSSTANLAFNLYGQENS